MEMLTPVTVRALLTENGIRPKKSLGQHFLADPNTARRVATLADVQPGDQVLEIGPGLGSLTLALLERGARVRAVELDASLARVLEQVLDAAVGPESDSVDVRVGDAYTIDLVGAARRTARSGRASPTFPTTSPSRWWPGCSKRRRPSPGSW